MITLLTSLNIAGLILAVFFITLILSKKGKQVHDYLLAFFIFLLGTLLLIKYMFYHNLVMEYPIILYLFVYYWVLLGPTLYIYTLVSTKGENKLRLSYLYTFIPAILVTICYSKYIFSDVTQLFVKHEKEPLIMYVGFYIWLANSPVFYILTILRIRKHQKKIKQHYSFSKSIDLKWLYYLSHGFAVFILFLLIERFLRNVLNLELPFDNYGVSLLVVFIYIFGIGYFGYRQKRIFSESHQVDPNIGNPQLKIISESRQSVKHLSYQKSGLNEEEAQVTLDKLKKLMLSEQPYLNSELNLATLALKVDISTHKLSQVINEYLDKTFFDFVNEYRIEKVKELLVDPANNYLKIISLAYDSGFNSKSTFYNLFKKSEGVTPAEYRLKIQRKVG